MYKLKMRPPVTFMGILNKIVNNKEEEMRKIVTLILVIVFLVISFGSIGIAGRGPAPSSGDGESEGPEWVEPYGNGRGPAPSSGDGISDGPGW